MFVNYVRERTRGSAVNVAAARLVLGLYLVWKLLSFDWGAISTWPVYPLFVPDLAPLVPSSTLLDYLWVEQWLAVLALCLFVVGYRTPISGFVAAAVVAHLGVVLVMVNTSFAAKSFFLPAIFVLLFVVYDFEDTLSLDAARRTANRSIDELNDHLRARRTPDRRMTALAAILLVLSFSYFMGGVGKAVHGPLFEWVSAGNLQRYVLFENVEHHQVNAVARLVRDNDLLAAALGWGTVFLEVGFFVAVVARLPIWPFIIGLAGVHVGIALTMNPFFFDQFLLYALFVPWDRGYERVASDREVVLVYDRHCYFCVRTLYLFKNLDIHNSIRFYNQYDVPEGYRDHPDVDFEDAMYVFRDGTAYEGYHAFREVLRHYGVFFWFVWVMERKPVERVGERVYAYIAANRSRHFTCRIDSEDDRASSR